MAEGHIRTMATNRTSETLVHLWNAHMTILEIVELVTQKIFNRYLMIGRLAQNLRLAPVPSNENTRSIWNQWRQNRLNPKPDAREQFHD